MTNTQKLLDNVCIPEKQTHIEMLHHDETIKSLQAELANLREWRSLIQSEGAIAPAKYTIDSSTNAKGVTYYRLREGKKLIQSLGRSGEALADWRDCIKRRNAIQQIDSRAVQTQSLIEVLSKGIDYDLQSPVAPLELNQTEYVQPGAA